jgi:hypothetical protein
MELISNKFVTDIIMLESGRIVIYVSYIGQISILNKFFNGQESNPNAKQKKNCQISFSDVSSQFSMDVLTRQNAFDNSMRFTSGRSPN